MDQQIQMLTAVNYSDMQGKFEMIKNRKNDLEQIKDNFESLA